tara:strand:+ start:1413 stop:1781 length:369 start_codon:yes stop_codon:yes gene_type:complete
MNATAYGAAALFAQREFGGIIAPSEVTETIGTSVSNVLGNDPERVSFFLMNLGASDIYLSTTPSPSSSNGIVLSANGGFIGFNAKDDQIIPTMAWWALGAGASLPLQVLTQRRIRALTETGE